MAQNSMTGDFIQNMLALMQLRQQAEQFQLTNELNQQNSQANIFQLLSGITGQFPDRGAAADFLESAGQRFGLTSDEILALARGQSPTETSIRAGAANRGREIMDPGQLANQNIEASSAVTTGMNQSQAGLSGFLTSQLGRMTGEGAVPEVRNMLGEAALLRTLTGMDPGAFSLSQAQHNMKPEQLNQAARINLGIELSPAQMASNALTARGQDMGYSSSMAGNRLGWAQLAQQGELGMLGLQLEGQRLLLSSTGKSGLSITDIPELVQTQNSLMENLQKAQTPAARQQLESGLGTINSLLNGLGVPTPQITPGQNQFKPLGAAGLLPWNWNNRQNLPIYNPPTQQQQQGYQNLMGQQQPFRFGFP